MTIEERARKLQWMFYHGTGGDESELQFIERFLRELTEEVQEACASDADDEVKRARELQTWRGDYGGDMFRAGVTQGRAQAASLIAARIRARSKT